VVCGLLALVLGGIGILRTRPASGRSGRGKATLGTALGAALLGTTLGAAAVTQMAAADSAALPPINDITTNPADPPAFFAIASLDANAARDMAYPGESFAEPQRAAYPDLAPIRVAASPDQVFQQSRGAARDLGWEIVAEDAAQGRLEASDTSAIFRFVDDVVIRIRPDPAGGSVIDVRSKSRVGKSDLGANAARIRAFGAAVGS